jgi:chromosome segregation ATPase
MKISAVGLFFLETTPPLQKEGLPYWILWLLLCIILLLSMFIFLRDKDLRYRLNLFLSGAKRRMKRAQFQLRLTREKRKKADLLRDLGKKVRAENIARPRYTHLLKEIDLLEKKGAERQAELKGIVTRIMNLQKKQEELKQASKGPAKLKESFKLFDTRKILAFKDEGKRLRRDIKDCEKLIHAGQELIGRIDRQKDQYFEQLGGLADEDRPPHEDFNLIYAQIDRVNRKILLFISQIEKLY